MEIECCSFNAKWTSWILNKRINTTKCLRIVSFEVSWRPHYYIQPLCSFKLLFVLANLPFQQLNLKKGSINEGILSKSYLVHDKHKWDAYMQRHLWISLAKELQCSLGTPIQQLLRLKDSHFDHRRRFFSYKIIRR